MGRGAEALITCPGTQSRPGTCRGRGSGPAALGGSCPSDGCGGRGCALGLVPDLGPWTENTPGPERPHVVQAVLLILSIHHAPIMSKNNHRQPPARRLTERTKIAAEKGSPGLRPDLKGRARPGLSQCTLTPAHSLAGLQRWVSTSLLGPRAGKGGTRWPGGHKAKGGGAGPGEGAQGQ